MTRFDPLELPPTPPGVAGPIGPAPIFHGGIPSTPRSSDAEIRSRLNYVQAQVSGVQQALATALTFEFEQFEWRDTPFAPFTPREVGQSKVFPAGPPTPPSNEDTEGVVVDERTPPLLAAR